MGHTNSLRVGVPGYALISGYSYLLNPTCASQRPPITRSLLGPLMGGSHVACHFQEYDLFFVI